MRTIVVGLGVQGHKRIKFCGDDFVASVDPYNDSADYSNISNVPLSDYDAAMCCVPDESKVSIIEYLLANGKHVLVEKPLWGKTAEQLLMLQKLSNDRGVVCYTAFNHRFEPHFVRMRDLISSGSLGEIYRCRMFYGNGTARLVRDSAWRDKGSGVLHDLGSHLLDALVYWFGPVGDDFSVFSSNAFENKAPDHVIVGSEKTRPRFELEMTLLSWRNQFTCDVFAEKGSVHIDSLCKWGPATFLHRTRVLPSGRPEETRDILEQEDPTWDQEYAHFKALCMEGKGTDLNHDIWLNSLLHKLGSDAISLRSMS